MKPLALSLAFILLACGCGRPTQSLSVNLVSVHFDKATPFETTATFILRLSNESPDAMTFTGSAHKIYLNGLYVGSGLSADSLEVPRLSSVTNAVVMHLNNLALATRVKSMIEAKTIDCRIQSVFYGKSWFSRRQTVTDGKLDLNDFTPTPGPDTASATNSSAPPPAKD